MTALSRVRVAAGMFKIRVEYGGLLYYLMLQFKSKIVEGAWDGDSSTDAESRPDVECLIT